MLMEYLKLSPASVFNNIYSRFPAKAQERFPEKGK